MPSFLWLKFGQAAVEAFVIRSDGTFKVAGGAGSVCQVLDVDVSTLEINGVPVPCGASGWSEATAADLGFAETSEEAPLLVTGEPDRTPLASWTRHRPRLGPGWSHDTTRMAKLLRQCLLC